MRLLLHTALAFVWLTAYLGLAYAVCRYRYARARALGLVDRREYRADRDWVTHLAVFALGVALALFGYLAGRALLP